MITSYPYGDFHSSGNVAPVRASSSLSPLKPQRGRTDFKSYALLFVLMLSHVTATINPLGYFVIIYLVCATILEKCFEVFKKGRAIKEKETPAGIPVGVSCSLKGFDVVFRVFLP